MLLIIYYTFEINNLIPLQQHSKKVSFANWHPTVHELICSGSYDNTVHIWNIQNGSTIWESNFGSSIVSLEWSLNGSLIGCTTKERQLVIADPRSNDTKNLVVNAHDSNKSQKMTFLGIDDYVLSCGSSKSNERQLKLWDMRNFTKE